MVSRILLAGLLFLLGVADHASGQPRAPRGPAPTTIILKSRSFDPAPGVDGELTRLARRVAADDRIHFILQFTVGTPDSLHQGLAARDSVLLLGRLTPLAYLASASVGFTLRRPQAAFVRWMGVLAAADKVAATPGSTSALAPTNSTIAAIVEFFGDIGEPAQQQTLAARGISALRRIDYLNAWSVIATRDSVLSLASADGVQWIEALPRGPESDNDVLRGERGVDADAVAAGTAYNLTGAGITVGAWDDAPATTNHEDFLGRLTIVGSVPLWGRYMAHDERGAINGRYNEGESVYIDINDDGCVTQDDVRVSPFGVLPAGSTVAPGDADALTPCTPLQAFWLGDPLGNKAEKYVDLNGNLMWEPGEPIYVDEDNSLNVNAADTRESAVIAANGARYTSFHNKHTHPTNVAGTIMGSGAHSAAAGGSAYQWRGVASGAQLRSYTICEVIECITQRWTATTAASYVATISDQYIDAGSHGVVVATHAWGSLGSHFHELRSSDERYGALSDMYDEAVSGLTHDGLASTLPRLFITASAGNAGTPERHTENVLVNAQYDQGEAIYLDRDGDREVSTRDSLVAGAEQPFGSKLVEFRLDEAHIESSSGYTGVFDNGEGVYLDMDRSGTVTPGDIREDVQGQSAGSMVVAASSDVTTPRTFLRPFKYWSTLRSANAAKNTLQLGNIAADGLAIATNSSRGPTADGRTKPDLVAAGSKLGGDGRITTTHTRNRYTSVAGTSISTAAAAGATALLAEWYRNACSSTMPPADVMKALLIHGAEDIVLPQEHAPVGPDFSTGFGRLDIRQALDLIPHHVIGTTTFGVSTYTITIGRTQPLKVTLAWNDAPASPNAAPGEHGLLANDLDLTLVAPDGTRYTAWVLEPSRPNLPATRGVFGPTVTIPEWARDRVNTVEQVLVDDAQAGHWKIEVRAAQLTNVGRPFTLVSEAFAPQAGPCAAAPATDVWMKDNLADDGTTPSAGQLWLSPDVWNRHNPDGLSAHENPEFGQPNYLYATVRNRSAEAARATTVEVWIADASTGLSWPGDFRLVGRIGVPNLGAGASRLVGPLRWTPPSPAASSHFCLYIRVSSTQDPIAVAEVSAVSTNTRDNNNIAWRNLHIVDLASSQSQTFVIRNPDAVRKTFRLEFRTPAAFFAAGGEIRISVAPELAQLIENRLNRSGLTSLADSVAHRDLPALSAHPATTPYRISSPVARLDGLTLRPREAHRVTVTFSSSNSAAAAYDMDVIQASGEDVTGGIRYVVRTGHR